MYNLFHSNHRPLHHFLQYFSATFFTATAFASAFATSLPPVGNWRAIFMLQDPGWKRDTLKWYPLSSKIGTYETVKARFWPWLSGKSP